ncbi:MAG TPA: class I SAM-dependent methyltransferase [Pseudomonadales bacterium]|nr:class I SAM-dependent methyltransferase [Pseudomonadales bacterium]
MHLPVDPSTVKGFLDPEEGRVLYETARDAPGVAPCLEIGSYCGKSTLYLGAGCAERGAVLFAVDHHQGSEEHQPGEGYFDPELVSADGGVDTFASFRDTMRRARLEDTVVPVVAPSAVAARAWATPLAMVFIDGGHSMEAALTDYRCWAPRLMSGGILAIHDIFPDPADGGRPPFEIWELARRSGLFEDVALVKTLGLLRRLG